MKMYTVIQMYNAADIYFTMGLTQYDHYIRGALASKVKTPSIPYTWELAEAKG